MCTQGTIWLLGRKVLRSTSRITALVGAMQASVTYYLLSDNRRRMPSSAYLRAEMSEGPSNRHAGKQHFVHSASLSFEPIASQPRGTLPRFVTLASVMS